jgi:hypothetical protein
VINSFADLNEHYAIDHSAIIRFCIRGSGSIHKILELRDTQVGEYSAISVENSSARELGRSVPQDPYAIKDHYQRTPFVP